MGEKNLLFKRDLGEVVFLEEDRVLVRFILAGE